MHTKEVWAMRGRMSFTFNNNATDIVSLQFSADLAVMLGFDLDKTYVISARRKFKAQKPMHLCATINNVFMYCNLLEHVIIGNTKTPLLRIFNKKPM